MPALVKRLTAAGLIDVDFAAASLDEAAEFEPRQGVYTVSNTYHGTLTLLLDAHLHRLEDSARREGFVLRYDRPRLRQALRRMIEESGFRDARFRISVPGDRPDEMLLSIERFQAPPLHVAREGARCITSAEVARVNPASKTSEWMHIRKRLASARPPDIYETFIVNAKDQILEGLSSNFYAIEYGELRTAGAQVLAGISRQVVMETCAAIIPLRLDAPLRANIPHFSEAFLTSSSRGIIPVVEIDGISIGDGSVGKTTGQLRDAYEHWVAEHLEEL